jgi:DNA-binding response OmpR family regulator
MSKLILSVSYEEPLLKTRHALLERHGYAVTSALGFAQALAKCKDGAFDLLILGHSIPGADKEKVIKAFRSKHASPILSLWRQNEPIMATAEYLAFSDNPQELPKGVATIFARRAAQTSDVTHPS